MVLTWPDSVLFNALDPVPPRFGHPFHIVDFSDQQPRVLLSFGEGAEPITQSSMYIRLPSSITPAAQGGFWALPADEYRIKRFGATYQNELELSRSPSWFSERSTLQPGNADTPPSPQCVGIWEDDQGRVWAYCLRASPDYRAAHSRAAGSRGGAREGVGHLIDWHLLYHTNVDVIDAASGDLLAAHALPLRVQRVLADGRLVVIDYSPEGASRVLIVQLRLTGM
jgi:hypothetical protein